MSEPYLKVEDRTDDFKRLIESFKNDAVLIGIPQEDGPREKGPEGETPEINNATLMFINNFGSPANNIPARPVMEIGIRMVQDDLADEMGKAAKEALDKGTAAIEKYYNRAGLIGSNSVKNVINNQIDIEGPAESTLRARKYLTQKGFNGTKSLLVTGQLRNSITWVVDPGGR